MAKIYSAPKEIKKPVLDYTNYNADTYSNHARLETDYVNQVKQWAKEHGTDKESGNEVNFPVGDGYARYVILSLKPVELIHLDVGDAWQFQYANRLTASDIRKNLARQRSWNDFFKKHKSDTKPLDKITSP